MRHRTIRDKQIEDYNKEISALYNFRVWATEGTNSILPVVQAVDLYINHVKAFKQRAYIIDREESHG